MAVDEIGQSVELHEDGARHRDVGIGMTASRTRPPAKSPVTRRIEVEWLYEHADELFERYPGEWLAIGGAALVAHGPDLPRVLQAARAAGHPRPLITAAVEEPAGPLIA